MSIISKYSDFLNETLKSYEIEVVVKKLANFFDNLGFTRKYNFTETKSPYYQLVTDREYMKRELLKYKTGEGAGDIELKYIKKLPKDKRELMVNSYERALEEFKYGDITIFTDKNSPEITDSLLHLINTSGYFVSTIMKTGLKIDKKDIRNHLINQDRISIMIEPNFDSKVDFKGEYLYHSTEKQYLEKILKIGLAPKSKNTRSFYPERIYLSPNIEYLKAIKDQLSIDKFGDYVDLKIKNFSGLELYKDVRYKGGFFTYNNIHPKYIEVINSANESVFLNESDRGMEIYLRMKKAFESFDIGDRVVYKGRGLQLKDRVGEECEIIDKSRSHTQVKVRFDDNFKTWIDAIALKKVTHKAKVKWYSKGKLEEEGWENESKDFTGMPVISKTDKYMNLSYELEPLKDLEEMASNLTAEQYAGYIFENVNRVFEHLIHRRVVLVAKKCKDVSKSFVDPDRWDQEKKHSIYIYSYLPRPDGGLIIRGDDMGGDIYSVDLVKCANDPEKYPILLRNVRIFSNDDSYGEEEWSDE